jgi:hypothetical protein
MKQWLYEMSSWCKGKLIFEQVDEMTGWHWCKLIKWQVDQMTNWHKLKLMKWQTNETASWWKSKLMKKQVDELASKVTAYWESSEGAITFIMMAHCWMSFSKIKNHGLFVMLLLQCAHCSATRQYTEWHSAEFRYTTSHGARLPLTSY